MTRDEFEFLVSQWLDEPNRTDLAAAIVEAVGATPEFEAVRDSWARFDRALHRLAVREPLVNWKRQGQHIAATTGGAALFEPEAAADAADRRIDAMLASLPQPAVDWKRFRGRISDAAMGQRQRSYRVGWAAGLTAAAAIIATVAFRLGLTTAAPQGPKLIARATVEPAGIKVTLASAVVRVTVGRSGPVAAPANEPKAEGEFFLMVDPAPAAHDPTPQVSEGIESSATRLAMATAPRDVLGASVTQRD